VVHVSWYEYPAFETDPAAFAKQVADEVGGKDVPVFLICRSGQRTVDAAKALEAAGFADVTNILHGFEGSLDENFHRSTLNGWRFDGLPWEQM
jgi:rhodanese-related sulfurtransferase